MSLIADGLLLIAAGSAAVYCAILSRRLSRLSGLDAGLGKAIVSLTSRVDEMKTALADDLGIDPGPTVQTLHDKILRQQPLDVKKAARTTAVGRKTVLDQRTRVETGAGAVWLVDSSGHRYPLRSVATKIGRLPDNDIVLDDEKVSRHHAAIIDTGTGFAVSDLRSANGVELGGSRIQGSVALADGDQIRICGHVFTFEYDASGAPAN